MKQSSFEVTENERRVIESLREMATESDGRPFTLIVTDVTGRGFYQLLQGVPFVPAGRNKRHIVNRGR